MANIIRPSLVLFLLPLAACGSGAGTTADTTAPRATEPPEVTDVEVWVAEDWRVEVAHLTEPNRALIRVYGSGGELDGMVLPYRYETTDSGRRWVTQHRGRERSVLYGIRRHDGEAPYRIHLPGARSNRPAERVEDAPPGLGEKIASAYAEQMDAGKVEELQRFDRAFEEGREDEAFQSSLEGARDACGDDELEGSIDWSTVEDERLLDTSIAGYCDGVLFALRSACDKEGGAEWLAARVDRVTCRIAAEGEPELTLDGETLVYRAPLDGVNLDQKAHEALLRLPDEDRGDLGGVLALAAARVCADSSGERFIVLSPRTEEMAYGTRDAMVRVRQPDGLSTGWFFEPRHFNERHNAGFRGHDLRYYSRVDADDEGCSLKCGEREVELTLLEGDAKAEIFGLERGDPPFDRVPHALARDRRGVYYYVDRGATEATARDFRLYSGRRGALRQLDMRDIVSDSEGEVFESASGTLRLVVDRDEALWIRGKRSTQLKTLPVGENLGVIFNELGVYLGEPLGTPCDDL
ncbi:MAG: hypothetical protein ACODAU_13830 [Myxococcota bacterium]